MMEILAGKHVLLGLSGGVACFKSAQLCRLLVKAGAQVQVVMTAAAQQFITAVTMQALSGRAVYADPWDARAPKNMAHITLGRAADVIVVAPCSANFISRLAQGRSDDLLSLLCLARPAQRVPLLLAPAMNREMWAHASTQRNLAQAVCDGARVLGVAEGAQACGESGGGRMLEAEEIAEEIAACLTPKLLAGRRVLMTAGPTFEAIDPVRGMTNHSSGKMGFALARAAHAAGAAVTLVAGPVQQVTPRGVRRINVQSAQDMLAAVQQQTDTADVFIAAAAVADWRAASIAGHKIKKEADGLPPALHFVENPDILATVAHSARARSGALYCVGFAAESGDLLRNASAKRLRKQVPLMVGNIGPDTFGQDDNALLLIDDSGARELPRAPKAQLAAQLVREIAARLPAARAKNNAHPLTGEART